MPELPPNHRLITIPPHPRILALLAAHERPTYDDAVAVAVALLRAERDANAAHSGMAGARAARLLGGCLGVLDAASIEFPHLIHGKFPHGKFHGKFPHLLHGKKNDADVGGGKAPPPPPNQQQPPPQQQI